MPIRVSWALPIMRGRRAAQHPCEGGSPGRSPARRPACMRALSSHGCLLAAAFRRRLYPEVTCSDVASAGCRAGGGRAGGSRAASCFDLGDGGGFQKSLLGPRAWRQERKRPPGAFARADDRDERKWSLSSAELRGLDLTKRGRPDSASRWPPSKSRFAGGESSHVGHFQKRAGGPAGAPATLVKRIQLRRRRSRSLATPAPLAMIPEALVLLGRPWSGGVGLASGRAGSAR